MLMEGRRKVASRLALEADSGTGAEDVSGQNTQDRQSGRGHGERPEHPALDTFVLAVGGERHLPQLDAGCCLADKHYITRTCWKGGPGGHERVCLPGRAS